MLYLPTLFCTTLSLNWLNHTTLHSTVIYNTANHWPALNNTELYYATLQNKLHCILYNLNLFLSSEFTAINPATVHCTSIQCTHALVLGVSWYSLSSVFLIQYLNLHASSGSLTVSIQQKVKKYIRTEIKHSTLVQQFSQKHCKAHYHSIFHKIKQSTLLCSIFHRNTAEHTNTAYSRDIQQSMLIQEISQNYSKAR